MKVNTEILKGLAGLLVLTLLIWSLNGNFKFVNATFLEIFGVVTFGFMLGASFLVKK